MTPRAHLPRAESDSHGEHPGNVLPTWMHVVLKGNIVLPMRPEGPADRHENVKHDSSVILIDHG